MDINYMVKDNQLIINNHHVNFLFPIRTAQILDGNIIVLLAIPFNNDTVDNLYLIDSNGEIVWQSQKLKELYPTEKLLPYEQMVIDEQGIRVTDFYGRRYFIDLSNGKIIKRDIIK